MPRVKRFGRLQMTDASPTNPAFMLTLDDEIAFQLFGAIEVPEGVSEWGSYFHDDPDDLTSVCWSFDVSRPPTQKEEYEDAQATGEEVLSALHELTEEANFLEGISPSGHIPGYEPEMGSEAATLAEMVETTDTPYLPECLRKALERLLAAHPAHEIRYKWEVPSSTFEIEFIDLEKAVSQPDSFVQAIATKLSKYLKELVPVAA